MKSSLFKPTLLIAITCFITINYTNAQQGQVVLNQDRTINSLLELKKEMNKNSDDYYKIQIYSGDRNGAQKAQKEFKEAFTDWNPTDIYEPPNFKIWAGNFKTRLEADRALKQIKQEFPSAFIFKPKAKN
ncbi:SPOR domain-containing protein [Aestuariivivens insulae]|uniref:SPOR domain-containing protein n=1 Tax=Aestuariivivens insulae TaxID=1621988 RepID=UPI001F5638C8|nr:SPOR domain-containing protein [Aestuariivivens insulae]